MNKNKAKNEKIKRKYFTWLKGGKGYSKLTIESIEKAIWDYEEFTKEADYKDFTSKTAEGFVNWLAKRNNKRSKQPLSLATQYHILRHLKDFFSYLSGQPGYKKISIYDIQYFRLDKNKSRIAISPKLQEYPSVDYIEKMCTSIKINNDIDRRDRALIAFALLSGMRDGAIVSLPLECFDPETLTVYQLPEKGVRTKFSKTIITTLFKFDDRLIRYVLDWYSYLKKEKLFSNINPLFPRTKLEQKAKDDLCFTGTEIEPIFWKSAGAFRIILKRRAEEAGQKYYSPHKLRHTATNEAGKYCKTAEELRAVSQNLGHENIGTTLRSYGRLDAFRQANVISSMEFKEEKEGEKQFRSRVATRELFDKIFVTSNDMGKGLTRTDIKREKQLEKKMKKTAKKTLKKVKSELKTLRKKAWDLQSKHIRKESDGVCFTCGRRGEWKEMDCGHFIHKDSMDFDDKALRAQCVRCNRWLHGNLGNFANKLIKIYGPGIVDELNIKANKVRKYTRYELEKIIKKYEGKECK